MTGTTSSVTPSTNTPQFTTDRVGKNDSHLSTNAKSSIQDKTSGRDSAIGPGDSTQGLSSGRDDSRIDLDHDVPDSNRGQRDPSPSGQQSDVPTQPSRASLSQTGSQSQSPASSSDARHLVATETGGPTNQQIETSNLPDTPVQLAEDVQKQDNKVAGGLLSWLGGAVGNAVRTVSQNVTEAAVARYQLDYEWEDESDSETSDVVATPRQQEPHKPAASQGKQAAETEVRLTAAQEAKANIALLKKQVEAKVCGLIQHMHGLKNPELTAALDKDLQAANLGGLKSFRKPGSLVVPSNSNSGVAYSWTDSLKGYAEAAKKSSVWFGVALGLPSAANFLVTMTGSSFGLGVGVVGAAYCAATYQAIDTAEKFPELAKDETFKSLANGVMADVVELGEQLDRLESQERIRQTLSDRVALVNRERKQLMQALTREIQGIEKVLSDGDRKPVVGTGEMRSSVLGVAATARAAFADFFAALASMIGQGVMYLPNWISLALARRDATKAEQSYAQCYEAELDGLAARDDEALKAMEEAVDDAMIESGYSQAQRKESSLAVQRKVCIGESLAQILRDKSDTGFGFVTVSSTALPASVTLARGLAWHLFVEADRSKSRHADGSMTVADSGGQLYGFLLSVPSAYTERMAGLDAGGAQHGSVIINDPALGLPGGGQSMRFEQAVNADTGERELRLSFLKSAPAPIFAPLGNEQQISRNIFVDMRVAEKQADASTVKVDSQDSDEVLRGRLAKLKTELLTQQMLEQQNLQQARELQGWVQPDFMSGMVPAYG